MLLLLTLAVGVFIAPQGTMPAASGDCRTPLREGILEGYNTMDTLASLMFGALIVDLLRQKGIHDYRASSEYLAIAGIISAIGLSVVYVSLFQLGNTAAGVATDVSNGGAIVNAYVLSLFGQPGQFILAAIITLACFTTAVGLISRLLRLLQPHRHELQEAGGAAGRHLRRGSQRGSEPAHQPLIPIAGRHLPGGRGAGAGHLPEGLLRSPPPGVPLRAAGRLPVLAAWTAWAPPA